MSLIHRFDLKDMINSLKRLRNMFLIRKLHIYHGKNLSMHVLKTVAITFVQPLIISDVRQRQL